MARVTARVTARRVVNLQAEQSTLPFTRKPSAATLTMALLTMALLTMALLTMALCLLWLYLLWLYLLWLCLLWLCLLWLYLLWLPATLPLTKKPSAPPRTPLGHCECSLASSANLFCMRWCLGGGGGGETETEWNRVGVLGRRLGVAPGR